MPTGLAEVVTRVECSDQICMQTMTDMLQGLPADTYMVWVRAVDTSGHESGWCEPLEIQHDEGIRPNPPLNLRIDITINVNVRVNP